MKIAAVLLISLCFPATFGAAARTVRRMGNGQKKSTNKKGQKKRKTFSWMIGTWVNCKIDQVFMFTPAGNVVPQTSVCDDNAAVEISSLNAPDDTILKFTAEWVEPCDLWGLQGDLCPNIPVNGLTLVRYTGIGTVPLSPGPDDHIQFISDFEEFLDANGVFQISTASTGDYDVVTCYNPIKNNKEVPNELSCNLVGHGLRDGGGTLGVVQTFSNLSVRDHKYCGFCPEEA